MLRTGNKGLAAGTLLLDLLKGFAPVLIAEALVSRSGGPHCRGRVLGHCFPVWLGFKGGKGVATNAGVAFACLAARAGLCLGLARPAGHHAD